MTVTLHAEALFASFLQPSQLPTSAQVADAVCDTMLRLGAGGCAAAVAGEYGDHPETAVPRMRWALAMAAGSDTGAALLVAA
jgi:hypothetical protein